MKVSLPKNKVIVCVFAHPDDEAFGPGGTIATLSKNNDVYLICATKGEAGKNSSQSQAKIHHIRQQELLDSTSILGVKKVFFLNFKDGTLCNNLYHQLADEIKQTLDSLQPDILLTYEPRGISGHIDHITISMVTSYIFRETKTIKQLWYYCIVERKIQRMGADKYFIYFPPGYKKSDIDLIVHTVDVWETKVEAMKQHQSQIHDIRRILPLQTLLPKEEYFLVTKR